MSRAEQWTDIETALRTRWARPWMNHDITRLERKVKSWANLEHLAAAVEAADTAGATATMNELLVDASRRQHAARTQPATHSRSRSRRPAEPPVPRVKPGACECGGDGWIDTGRDIGLFGDYGPMLKPCPGCMTATAFMHSRGHYEPDVSPKSARYLADAAECAPDSTAAKR